MVGFGGVVFDRAQHAACLSSGIVFVCGGTRKSLRGGEYRRDDQAASVSQGPGTRAVRVPSGRNLSWTFTSKVYFRPCDTSFESLWLKPLYFPNRVVLAIPVY